MPLKPGDVLTSTQGTGLTLTIKKVTKTSIIVEFERRVIVDKGTGEVKIDKREREIPLENWQYVRAVYA